MKLSTLLLILYAAVFTIQCAGTSSNNQFTPLKAEEKFLGSRSAYGKSTLPIWVPITDFETRLLTSKKSNHRYLLGLSLVASGDIRSVEDYTATVKKIDAFIKWIAPAIKKSPSFKSKGKLLFIEMQKKFYPQVLKDNSDYDFDQSKLSTLLISGEYNCISSALLYGILAEAFSLNPKGVTMPSHAFIQIDDGNGEVIEIETTSYEGYNQKHDQSFYNKISSGWFLSLGITEATYENYLKREIVPLKQLAIHNFANQHISSDVMPLLERIRLLELRGYLDLHTPDAVQNLLFYYYWEAEQLIAMNAQEDYARFLKVISPHLEKIMTIPHNQIQTEDFLFWSHAEKAKTLFNSGLYEESQASLNASKLFINKIGGNVGRFEDYETSNFINAVNTFNTNGSFEKGVVFQDTYYQSCTRNTQCAQILGYLYINWANSLWDQKKWESIIEILIRFQKTPYTSPVKSTAQQMMEGAFLNWSYAHSNNREWNKARNILKHCLSNLPDNKKCSSQLIDLKDY